MHKINVWIQYMADRWLPVITLTSPPWAICNFHHVVAMGPSCTASVGTPSGNSTSEQKFSGTPRSTGNRSGCSTCTISTIASVVLPSLGRKQQLCRLLLMPSRKQQLLLTYIHPTYDNTAPSERPSSRACRRTGPPNSVSTAWPRVARLCVACSKVRGLSQTSPQLIHGRCATKPATWRNKTNHNVMY